MQNGALVRVPTPAHSSIGFDANGTMHVGRISFSGTWKGTGQRRPLEGVNQQPRGEPDDPLHARVGRLDAERRRTPRSPCSSRSRPPRSAPTSTRRSPRSAPARCRFPPTAPSSSRPVQTPRSSRPRRRRATQVTVRLILPDAWSSVVSAFGGGPQLVKGGKPLFTTGENFDPVDLATRQPRTAVGQLADGRVILVTVDGGRPGYSVGMTSYELAKTMAKLGAVTAAGLQYGRFVTAAFDGEVVNRLSQARQVPVKEALLVQYAGVYAPPPSVTVARQGERGGRCEARLPRHAALHRHGERRRPRRHRPPGRLGQPPARHLQLHLERLRHRGNLALDGAGDRRPESPVHGGPDVLVRSHAHRALGRAPAGRSASRSPGPPPPFCRSPPRTAPSSTPSRRQACRPARSRSRGTASPPPEPRRRGARTSRPSPRRARSAPPRTRARFELGA